MHSPGQILKDYWGFDQFRPLQEEIIRSVLDGRDTLALLPTGGGKSLCFQVPALCMEKTCLVISPLIALMKDQVEHLRNKGIRAEAITSDLNHVELSQSLDRCLEGSVQFIYASPERLKNEGFREVLLQIKPGIFAVDEAHCISQWGYDFRPAYLQIAEIREQHAQTPVIALTATATPQVCNDIEEKLHFKNHRRFKKSFIRPNLTYVVRKTENKQEQLLRILNNIPGSSVVYLNNRKKTREIATFLQSQGISSSYYHAGLDPYTRNLRQESWIKGNTRVIVCTNAFGMGIDKPDVRTVIHMGIPESPEAYFQEAGRAGRNGEKAWAVLLSDQGDIREMELRFEEQFPEFETVKAVYNWLGNFFQLPVGSGEQQSYPFNIAEFVARYKLSSIQVMQSLRFMEREGLIAYIDNQLIVSKLRFLVNHDVLYDFQFRNPSLEPLIVTILRSYAGVMTDFVPINENELANRLLLKYERLVELLRYLDKCEILSYIPATGLPNIYYLYARQHPDHLPLSKKNYESRKQAAHKRLLSMLNYVQDENTCRSVQLVTYFGEQKAISCGSCDVCIENQRKGIRNTRLDKRCMDILHLLERGIRSPEQIMSIISNDPDFTADAIRTMLDEGLIREDSNGLLIRVL